MLLGAARRAAAVVLAARAALAGRALAQVGGSIAAALLLYPAALAFALPALGTGFPSPRLAALIAQYRPCASGPAYSVGYHEPSLVFLTETGIRLGRPPACRGARCATDPGALVLVEDRGAQALGPEAFAGTRRARPGELFQLQSRQGDDRRADHARRSPLAGLR